jgi:hypothetical protein
MVKAFTKKYTFMIKILRKLRIKGHFHYSIKNIYIRCTVKLMLDGEVLKAFLPKARKSTKVSFPYC